MSLLQKAIVTFVSLLVLVHVRGTELFVSPTGGHVAPFTDWPTAATNIQAAIDAAASGDIVTVTNGLYAEGGKVKSGDLTNRIALDKPILVRSVNGPNYTIIQGAWDSATTNGPGAVRCAWLTNGATLSGFTLRGGATRTIASPTNPQMDGGGVWGSSTNATVADCLIEMNFAGQFGGGAYQVSLNRCTLTANRAVGSGTPGAGIANAGSGGGAYACNLNACRITDNRADQSFGGGVFGSVLRNCALMNNSAYMHGGAAHSGTLINCTVTGNTSSGYSSGYGSAVYGATLVNSLVWGNLHRTANPNTNYASCSFSFCDTFPAPPGAGNIGVDPQLLGDGYHLATTSPCRGAGTNLVSGADIDGQSWSNPPSMGCDEWIAAPTILSQPKIMPGPQGQLLVATLPAAGQSPMAYSWLRDGASFAGGHYGGAESTRLLINNFGPQDVGGYQIIASNAFGMATSAVAQVTVHCVDVAGASPATPYTDWFTAATNIQAAIDAAVIGDIILVTNGVYDSGGKVISGDLTNRIAIDKAVIVMSVNGAANTFIVGTPGRGGVNSLTAPNGPHAVRCTWMADGAILSGFTLQGGGTRVSTTTVGSATNSGGGVWCASQGALLTYCTIAENSAYFQGGGAFGGTLNNCTVVANAAGIQSTSFGPFYSLSPGGGVYNCNLNNCLVRANQSGGNGGGAYGGTLNNCTLISNRAGSGANPGGGANNSILRNSILWNNTSSTSGNNNASGGNLQYCCSGNVASGTGNIPNNPLFLIDGFHLSSASPCRGAGSPAYASGTDLDGQTWTNPPSMGCDEWLPEPVLFGFKIQANSWGQFDFATQVAGIESSPGYWFKDGSLLIGSQHYLGADTTRLTVKGLSAADTGDYQLVVSNAFGMTTSRVASVVVHFVNVGNPGATAPFTNWATAAGNIQDAIDAATPDAVILVTNGIYNTGGKMTDVFDVTNRVALDKPVTVVSVNGPFQTAIEGRWDLVSTNGVNAVRCAQLSSNSSLAGFTLRNGATRTSGLGGGALADADAMVSSCVISNNRASGGGGAAYGSYYSCWFISNSANSTGGGVFFGTMNNCTVVENSAGAFGGGANASRITNCIVWNNSAPSIPNVSTPVYSSCSPSIGTSSGNITNNPQLVDGLHLAANSPCRGVGAANLFSTTDLDGDAWSSPPSMGADEFPAAGALGPLTVAIESSRTTVVANHPLTLIGRITGNVASLEWNYGDGPAATNASYYTTHSWTSPGDYLVTLTAFNTDNLPGVSTNVLIRVEPLLSPVLAPSLSGSTTNFQIQFLGQAGINYGLEYATNLSVPTTWFPLKSLTSTGGVVQFTDTTATNTARFYRVKAQ